MRRKKERLFRGILNRILQNLARSLPGASGLRIRLHRLRGVKIGKNSWVGYDVIIDTSTPDLIRIGNNVTINMRSILIAHFREREGIIIHDDVFIGPGTIILPSVTIGRGAVISAGSVVTKSVPELTVVQGNPAKPVAKCTVPLGKNTPYGTFSRTLRPIVSPSRKNGNEVQ